MTVCASPRIRWSLGALLATVATLALGVGFARAQQSVFVCTSASRCQTVALPAAVPDDIALLSGLAMTVCPRGLPLVDEPIPGGEVVVCGGGFLGTTLASVSSGPVFFGAGADFCSLSAGASVSTAIVGAGITDC